MSRPQLTGEDQQSWTLATHLASPDCEREIEAAVSAAEPAVSIVPFDALIGGAAAGTPTVVVFDDSTTDWLTTIADLVAECPEVRPVLLAHIDRPDRFLGAVMAGVVGFCDADANTGAIVRSINSVRVSGVAIPRPMVAPLVAHLRDGHAHQIQTSGGTIDITNREWQILVLLMQRRSTNEMAEALYVSPGTVRSHVSALMGKIGAADREDAIRRIASGQLELLGGSASSG